MRGDKAWIPRPRVVKCLVIMVVGLFDFLDIPTSLTLHMVADTLNEKMEPHPGRFAATK